MGVSVLLLLLVAGGQVSAQEPGDAGERALSACDRFMESYARSAARKLDRAMSTGDYGLRPLDELDGVLRLASERPGQGAPLELEVFKEASGRVVGLVDRRRQWTQTYVVAMSRTGPIVVSHRWQERRLREAGQPCAPFASALEWPGVSASRVDVEPFKYWGLRVVWRIPRADEAASGRALEEVLTQVARRYERGASEAGEPGVEQRDVTQD
ncbi:hypothetical protein DL240_10645 [Lujinxingia litoralis]|uniref:Methanolan biosynthesis EpsI domain-containing protein n=1 Tax=Lujinxingia litoralis TaxID=2211119 RepID=A0A328C655_9DELT|nr:hypothetical protein DL240_10645 [Lujinxingia litoralis]